MASWRTLLLLSLVAFACKKEEVKEYTVSLQATCFDCIVQYASGPDRGRYDTLSGSINGADTVRETGNYQLVMRADELIFFRACRISPDTARFGEISLSADGDILPLSTLVDRATDCATINQPVQFRE